jgi:hypothetical protein
MDHRLSPLPNGTPQMDGANSDIYALDVPVIRTQQSPQLQKIGPVAPDAPDPLAAVEAAADALNQSYRPTVNGQRLQLVRGDFHRHSELSFDGVRDGPMIDSYRYFIDAVALGWVGCCDHDNGGSREYSWWMIQKFTTAYLLGSKFIPMYYYERSINYPEGHRNVLFSQRGIRPLPRLPLSSTSTVAPAPASLPRTRLPPIRGRIGATMTRKWSLSSRSIKATAKAMRCPARRGPTARPIPSPDTKPPVTCPPDLARATNSDSKRPAITSPRTFRSRTSG